jgi:hypothetical protein
VFFEEAVVVPPPSNILFTSVTNLIEYLERLARLRIFPPATKRKGEALQRQGFAGYEACKTAFTALQPYLQVLGIIAAFRPANSALYRTIADQISPRATLPARLQGLLAATGTAAASPEFPDAMYAPLAARSTDYVLPGLDQVPSNRVALLKTNPAFIAAYMVGLNHEISREYLWREFPAPLNTTAFSQFWDERDNPADQGGKDIQAIATWGTSALGTHQPAGKVAEKMVVLVRGDLLQKYPHTEIFLQKAGDANGAILYPLFSARIEPDLCFIGFDLTPADALGSGGDPGWLFVLKERAGEVHFGLDLEASTADPSWEALAGEVPEHTCLNVSAPAFQALPRYTGPRADRLAAMLYQKPYMLLVPAVRLVSAGPEVPEM